MPHVPPTLAYARYLRDPRAYESRSGAAIVELSFVRRHKSFLGSRAARRILLRLLQHVPGVADGVEVLSVTQDSIRFGARAESNRVTVGVLAGKDVLVLRQRIKELLVQQ